MASTNLPKRHGWVTFAGVIALVAGTYNALSGIAAIADDDGPTFRVGVNTGPALVGNIGSTALRNFNAMGDAVNVAARLESVAEPGQVVIGAATRALLPADVVVEALGELAVKGRREPVTAFRLKALPS